MFKATSVSKSDIKSIVGCASNNYSGQVAIVPVTKRGMSNVTVSSGSGEYDGGDRLIGYTTAYEIDGDLLFTVGWGDGFAVRRLNDDGTMTRLFFDSNFLWRDSGSTYNHIQSICIDKINKKGVAMTYNVNGYTTFDYSGLMNGGSTFVKDPRPTHSNPQIYIGSQDTGGGYVESTGLYYVGALCAAGEWAYASDYDARHYKRCMRRNMKTGVEERLYMDATAGNIMLEGSAPVDRNGYRGWIMYDEINDRILYAYYHNANFSLILDASTAKPKSVYVDMGDIGQGDDGYEQGWFIPDPINEPNIFWVGASGRHTKLDVTPCLTGNNATVLQITYEGSTNPGNNYGILMRAGVKYQDTQGTKPTDRMVGYPNFIPTAADRGGAMIPGFLDQDNDRYVALRRHDTVVEDTTSEGRGRSYRTDYGCNITRMYSTGGAEWWIQMGYGYDGHGFRIWDAKYSNHFIPDWEIVYGPYTLDNSASIDFVFWNRVDYFIPNGCTLGYYVSNDDGATWEVYSGTDTAEHTFSKQGSKLQLKISASGDVSKNAYKMSDTEDFMLCGTKYAAEMDPAIKQKMTKFKLRGKKK